METSIPVTGLWVLLNPDDGNNTLMGLYWTDEAAEQVAQDRGWDTYYLQHYHVFGPMPETIQL